MRLVRRLIETGIRGDLDAALELYRRELEERGWTESSGETVVGNGKAKLKFASDGAELTLELKHRAGKTKITLNLSRRGEAEKAGVLPRPGRARIILANSAEVEVSITIDDQTFKLAAGEGADKPDGPSVHLRPGKYTVTVKMPGKDATSEELELDADQTWGLIVLPEGSLPLQIY